MKLNFGKKLLLFLHWLLSLAICALLVLMCAAPNYVRGIADLANAALGAGLAEIMSVVLLALYALLSILALTMIFSRGKKRSERGLITVDASESGRTRISIGAVEQMIRQAVRGVDGIAEMKCAISNDEDAISINANVTLMTGAHVPTVTMNMQRAIRGYIELNCGVAVREICVNVSSVESAPDGKRSSRKNLSAAAPVAVNIEPVQEAAVLEVIPASEPAQEEIPAEELPEEPQSADSEEMQAE